MSEEIKEITISMEEYKELLMIKGRYEELKQQSLYKPVLNRDFDLSNPRVNL